MTDNNIHIQQNRVTPTTGAETASTKGDKNHGLDPLLMAYLLLQQLTSVVSDTAGIKTKEMASNAHAQQILNKESSELAWNVVPKEIIHKWTSHEWHLWSFWKSKTIHHTEIKNIAEVDKAEFANQEVMAEKNRKAEQMKVLQQESTTQQTNVSSITDEDMQAMQQGASIMNLLKQLTTKALLRRPIQ